MFLFLWLPLKISKAKTLIKKVKYCIGILIDFNIYYILMTVIVILVLFFTDN